MTSTARIPLIRCQSATAFTIAIASDPAHILHTCRSQKNARRWFQQFLKVITAADAEWTARRDEIRIQIEARLAAKGGATNA